jgi:hypothetical protein
MKEDCMQLQTVRYRQELYACCVAFRRTRGSVRWLVTIAACCVSFLSTAHADVVNKTSIAHQRSEATALRIFGAVIVLAALTFAQNPLKRSDPFAGRFEGDQVALALTGANGQYTGTLTIQGQAFPITARVAGATANGVMQAGSGSFPFTLAPTANGLKLASEGSEYMLERHSAPGGPGQAVSGPVKSGNSVVGYWRNAQGHARFNADGTGEVDGENGRYEIHGNQMTLIGPRGQISLVFEVRGDILTLTINGALVTLNRVREEAGSGGVRQELVGKWCWISMVSAQHGASTSNRCFTLNANGTYQYYGESDSYNPYGGATSQSSDSGTWTATETTLTTHSPAKGAQVFTLEKRNHPKNGDPMLVVNGQPFVTYFQKTPW